MSNKINFLFRCNTLTSFERTSSSCVHCSNEQIETGSSGAPTIQNGYFGLRVQVPAVPEFLGAGIPRYPRSPALLPGGYSRPNSPAEHQGYHEVLGQERREGKGLLLPTTPPRARQLQQQCVRGRWVPTRFSIHEDPNRRWKMNINMFKVLKFLKFNVA